MLRTRARAGHRPIGRIRTPSRTASRDCQFDRGGPAGADLRSAGWHVHARPLAGEPAAGEPEEEEVTAEDVVTLEGAPTSAAGEVVEVTAADVVAADEDIFSAPAEDAGTPAADATGATEVIGSPEAEDALGITDPEIQPAAALPDDETALLHDAAGEAEVVELSEDDVLDALSSDENDEDRPPQRPQRQ